MLNHHFILVLVIFSLLLIPNSKISYGYESDITSIGIDIENLGRLPDLSLPDLDPGNINVDPNKLRNTVNFYGYGNTYIDWPGPEERWKYIWGKLKDIKISWGSGSEPEEQCNTALNNFVEFLDNKSSTIGTIDLPSIRTTGNYEILQTYFDNFDFEIAAEGGVLLEEIKRYCTAEDILDYYIKKAEDTLADSVISASINWIFEKLYDVLVPADPEEVPECVDGTDSCFKELPENVDYDCYQDNIGTPIDYNNCTEEIVALYTMVLDLDRSGVVWTDVWTKGATSMVTFTLDGEPYLLSHRASDGAVGIDKINAGGKGVTVVWTGVWTKGATSMVTFTLDGEPYLLSHRASDGAVGIDKINAGGKGVTVVWTGVWTKGATSIVPFTLDGEPYLLSHRASDGAVGIDKINAGGKGVTVVWTGVWTKGATSMVTFTLDGGPYLLSHRASDGAVGIDKINAGGKGVTVVWTGVWTKGATSIVPFTLDGEPYLLSHRASDGAVGIDKINAGGKGVTVVWTGVWTKGATSMVTFTLDGEPYLLSHRASDGATVIDAIKPGG